MIIVPIEIDTKDITSQFAVNQEQIDSMLDNIAKSLAISFVQKLELNVSKSLKSTRSRYLQSIRVIDSGRLQSTVLLDYSKDKLIQKLEEGSGPFDIKEGLLGSSKVHTTTKGKKYITVPFRWAVSSSLGESDVFSGVMPKEIHTIVKQKSLKEPLKLSEIPKSFSQFGNRNKIEDSEGKVLFDTYTHKSSVYEGISKITDNVTKQNRYMSFRRVSENSDPLSWVHSGFVAHNFIKNTYSEMNLEEEVGTQIDVELSKLGF